jgi:hypothetical protein
MTNKKETYNHNLNSPEKFGFELSKIKKENNFQVPENYFAELPQIIQEKANRKKAQFDMGSLLHYFLKPIRIIALGSVLVIIIVGLFLVKNQNQKDPQMAMEISFEELIQEYPEMVEYMDDHVLFELAATQMEQQDLDLIDYEFGFDSILLQNEVLQNLSDEEISEIIYNL